eukprot:1775859-Prymnesium_polylepis.1
MAQATRELQAAEARARAAVADGANRLKVAAVPPLGLEPRARERETLLEELRVAEAATAKEAAASKQAAASAARLTAALRVASKGGGEQCARTRARAHTTLVGARDLNSDAHRAAPALCGAAPLLGGVVRPAAPCCALLLRSVVLLGGVVRPAAPCCALLLPAAPCCSRR